MNRAGRREQHRCGRRQAKLGLNPQDPRPVLPVARQRSWNNSDCGLRSNPCIGRLPLRIRQPRPPPVAGRVIFLPQQPDLARVLGQQILARKSHGHRKPLRAFAHQHHVAGVLHHRFRDQGNILDIAHAAHRPRAPRRPMHAAGIEFDHAFFVRAGRPSPTLVIVRIVFRPGHHQDRGIQRVAALAQMFEGPIEVSKPVVRADDDGTLAGSRLRLRSGVGNGQRFLRLIRGPAPQVPARATPLQSSPENHGGKNSFASSEDLPMKVRELTPLDDRAERQRSQSVSNLCSLNGSPYM